MFKTFFFAIACLVIWAVCVRRMRKYERSNQPRIPERDFTGQRTTVEQYEAGRRREIAQGYFKQSAQHPGSTRAPGEP